MSIRNRLVTRNVTIDGRRTSIRLEVETWEALDEICALERLSTHQVCTLVDRSNRVASRTSAVRAFVVAYYRGAFHMSNSATLDGENRWASGVMDLLQQSGT